MKRHAQQKARHGAWRRLAAPPACSAVKSAAGAEAAGCRAGRETCRGA
jgi:hypothetical protein